MLQEMGLTSHPQAADWDQHGRTVLHVVDGIVSRMRSDPNSKEAIDSLHGLGATELACAYRDDSAPTRPALTRHRRFAASSSYDLSFDFLGLLFAKYVPLIPSTAGEDAK